MKSFADFFTKIWFFGCLFLLSSCSLINIESEQIPLSKTELNTRLLNQAFVQDASNRVATAADSILTSTEDIEVQKNALRWKINTLSSLKSVGFQTSPKIALMDTWTLMLGVRDFFTEQKSSELFKSYQDLVISISEENAKEIRKIAQVGIRKRQFSSTESFVNDFVKKYPINSIDFKHHPVRESYIAFRKIPDSLAVQTVGTLSEVVADLTNRMSVISETTGKQIQWNSELFLKAKGLDERSLQQLSDSINLQLDRFLVVAEQSPELLDEALLELEKQLQDFNARIDQNVAYTLKYLSGERELISEEIEKERIKLDSIIQRERAALSKDADELSTKLLDKTMNHVKELVETALFYIIILLAVIILLPFSVGYYVGKVVQRNKKKPEE